MACLFCGKEIGPLRLLRDSEFCSPKHRKQYKDRLQLVLVRVGEPETVPRGIAPFHDSLEPHPGPTGKSEAKFDFSSVKHVPRPPRTWTLEVPDAGAVVFASVELTARDHSSTRPALAWQAEAVPYFANNSAASLLHLPQPTLGSAALQSSNSQPVALGYPAAHLESPAAPSSDPAPVEKAPDLALLAFAVSAAECEELTAEPEPAPSETWMTTPAPQPADSPAQPSLMPSVAAKNGFHPPLALPDAATQPAPALHEFAVPPAPVEVWMSSSAASPANRSAQPSTNSAPRFSTELRLPLAFAAAARAPKPEVHALHLAAPAPNAAQMEAKLSAPPAVPFLPAPAVPGLASVQVSSPALPPGNTEWLGVSESRPAARGAQPSTAATPLSYSAAPVRFTPLVLQPVNDSVDTLVEAVPAAKTPLREVRNAPRAAAPKPPAKAKVDSRPAPVVPPPAQPAERPPVAIPPAAAAQPQTEIPQAGFFKVDYRSPIGPITPRPNLFWATSRSSMLHPARFAVRPIFERLEDQPAQKPERQRPAFAEIFTMPDAAALAKRKAARHAFTAIAASVTVAMALWMGLRAGKFGKELISREAADQIAAASRVQSNPVGPLDTVLAPSRSALPAPDPMKHPVAWIRTAAAKRAMVQVADTFENGMSSWGAKAKALAPGWTRSSDGYVRPGQLALFQPSLAFTDYRMDFFGQIENRSLSWAVRGKDTQNYYAMKFTITEPGIRPLISMTHYPVVGGKQGHKVEVPLSVMVHNNTPYHVSVAVKGSHYTASIEGQEVDSWSDDTLLAGGVGFFSEAGARARIYWMRVSKNDDWLGRLCNRIAGDADSGDSAWLDRPGLPVPPPDPPAPEPATAALWPAEAAETWYGKLPRERGSWKGEIETWSS